MYVLAPVNFCCCLFRFCQSTPIDVEKRKKRQQQEENDKEGEGGEEEDEEEEKGRGGGGEGEGGGRHRLIVICFSEEEAWGKNQKKNNAEDEKVISRFFSPERNRILRGSHKQQEPDLIGMITAH